MFDYENIVKNTHKAAEYFLHKISFSLGPVELKELIENDLNEFNLIDVRDYDDYVDGHIPFAVHMPNDKLDKYFELLSKDKANIIYCYNQNCHLGAKCAYEIAKHGYPVMELDGGFDVWEQFGFDIVRDSSIK